MRNYLAILPFLGFGICVFAQSADAAAVRISQVYPGGGADGQSGTPYKSDYVELFNSSSSPVDIGGWILAYDAGSGATSTYGCVGCNQVIPVQTVIAPCSYLLVQMSNPGLYGEALPAPDVSLPSNHEIGLIAGMALVTGGDPSGTCVTGETVVDLVKWGPGSCYLGSPATMPGYFQALLRRDGGMQNTNHNANDFEVAAPAPRNSASPGHPVCLASPAAPTSWGRLKIQYR